MSNTSGFALSCPFFADRQQEWQTTMSLPFAALESCKGAKACDKSVPTTTSITPIFHSEIKWPRNAEGDRQWFNSSGRLDSEIVDLASFVESKDTWKYAEEENFGESHLDSTKSLELDGELPMSSRNSGTALRQRPSTVDSELYPFSPKEKLMNESPKIRDVFSIQMPASRSPCFGQASGVSDPNVPVSESRSCTEKMVRGASHGSLCLEDGMRQLSTEDLLLALENPRKIRARLKTLSSKDQVDASCEGQKTYQPEQYLFPGKCSTSLTTTEFERLVTSNHFSVQRYLLCAMSKRLNLLSLRKEYVLVIIFVEQLILKRYQVIVSDGFRNNYTREDQHWDA